MTKSLNDFLALYGVEQAGPLFWDEKQEVWKLPVKPKVFPDPEDMPTTFSVKFEWKENLSCPPFWEQHPK